MDIRTATYRKRKADCLMKSTPCVVKIPCLLSELGVERLPDTDDEAELQDITKISHSDAPSIYIPTKIPSRPLKPGTVSQIQTLGPRGVFRNQPSPPLIPLALHHRWENAVRPSRQRAPYEFSSDPWNKLSDEVILNVFKWLPKPTLVRCLRVSKRWNRLAMDETLWRRLDLTKSTMQAGDMGHVLERGVAVLRLAQAHIHTPIYMDVNLNLEPRFSKVQYLDLSMSPSSTSAFEQILSTCHILRKLSLENCTINNAVCRAIAQNENLEVLNLNMCEGLTESGLVHICNKLLKLEALNIGWTGLSRNEVTYLTTCLPSSVMKLNLSGCKETLFDQDIEQLCARCPNMKELDVSDASLLTAAAVECIAARLGGLEYIALSRCYKVLPSSLPLLGQTPTLLALDVFGMLKEFAVVQLRELLPGVAVNKFPFSSIARPTTGSRRTSIWGLRVRDINVY